MARRTAVWIVAAFALAALTAVPVSAQPPEQETASAVQPPEEEPASAPDATDVVEPASTSERPYREPLRSLILKLSLAGGIGDDVGNSSASRPPSLYYTDGDAQLSYIRRREHGSVNLTGQSVFRYEPVRGEVAPLYGRAGGGFSLSGPRTQFSVSESMSYDSSYQFGVLPGAGEGPLGTPVAATQAHGDYGNAGLSAFSSYTTVHVARTLTRRSTLGLSYNGRHTSFSGTEDGAISAHMAAFRVTRRLTSLASLHAGYGYQFGKSVGISTAPGSPRAHNLDVGVDLGRALSLSKRTSFTFGTGSSVLTSDGAEYRLAGNAAVTRLIGRTGSAQLSYNRGVQMLEGFTGPVPFDAVAGTVSGTLRRHVTVTSSAGLMNGALASAGGGDFRSISASAGLGIVLSRRVRLDAQYFGYRQHVAASAVLPLGLAGALKRQGIRVGLTWDAPLLR